MTGKRSASDDEIYAKRRAIDAEAQKAREEIGYRFRPAYKELMDECGATPEGHRFQRKMDKVLFGYREIDHCWRCGHIVEISRPSPPFMPDEESAS